jgi:NAD(P)-dependent dehydrogenase (short-subunit alcohol dehydrogenase family)
MVTADAARTIVVTGASGGVGRGIALAAGHAGWTVWIAARRAEEGSQVAREVDEVGGQGRFVECDVSSAASVESAIGTIAATTDRLHGVVHNSTSGLSPRSVPMRDITVEDLLDHVAVSVRGMYLMGRATLPLMTAGRGSFVVTTSEAGFEGKKLIAAYAMVKASQRGMVRALAREWGPAGVRINAIAPMAMTPAMDKAFVSDPEMKTRVTSRIPLGRVGDPAADIGTVVRFLLSDDSSYVTGQTLMVDGGSCQIT